MEYRNFGPVATPLTRRILQTVHRKRRTSRAEIASTLGLSRSRLSPEIKRLFDSGLLAASGHASSNGGRRSDYLTMPGPDAGLVGGIDLDTGQATVGVTDLGCRAASHQTAELTVADGPQPVLTRLADLLDESLAEHAPRPLLAVGLGVPAPVDFETGRTLLAPIMPGWEHFPIRDFLIERLGVPVYVDGDVNILARGEMQARPVEASPALAEDTSFLCVRISTGIGCGVVIRGQPYRGEDGCAGDIGHICIDPASTVVCACGNRGCMEALAAVPAVLARAHAAGVTRADGPLGTLIRRGTPMSALAVGRAALAGDADAVDALRDSGRQIGLVLAGLVSFFNPTEIVVTSAYGDAEVMLLSEIRQEVYRRSLPLATRELIVSGSQVGPLLGVIGGAALAIDGLLAEEDDFLVTQAAHRLSAG